jgi:hypothetical protein
VVLGWATWLVPVWSCYLWLPACTLWESGQFFGITHEGDFACCQPQYQQGFKFIFGLAGLAYNLGRSLDATSWRTCSSVVQCWSILLVFWAAS